MNLIKNILTNKAKSKYKEFGLSEQLISIFLKPKKYRTSQDNYLLMQNYEYFECFQKILKNYKEGELMLDSIFKKLDFIIYDPGKTIYAPNDIISNMFYIFYGSVKINKNRPFNSPKRSVPERTKKKIKIKRLTEVSRKKDFRELGFVKKLINAMKKNLVKKESDLNDFDFYDNQFILSKGDEYGFDEINEKRRNYAVKTKTSCVIGFLSKEDWQLIFEKIDIIKKNDMLKFLEGLQIFRNRKNDKIINNIYNSINERYINIGDTLVNKGEDLKKVYIIRKGYFQVEIKMKEIIRNAFNDIDSFGNYNDKEKTENIKYEAKNYYTKEENFKIITYGKGEFLGDIEYYLGVKKYLTKILCKSSSSVVYEIKYEDLITHMTPNLNETLMKEGEAKLEYFRKRINEMKIIKLSKLNNKNKYKQIILNKLEEEKGGIFNDMENKKNGLFLYELKRRKRLKTASLNKNIMDIYINNNFPKNGNKYNNFLKPKKKGRNKIKSNYLSLYSKDINKNDSENKFVFKTSIKKNQKNLKLYQNNFTLYNENKINRYSNNNDKDTSSKIWNSIFNFPPSPNNQLKTLPIKSEKSISAFFNSIPNNKNINMSNIEIKNKIFSSKINNIKTLDVGTSPRKDIIKVYLNKNFIPKTPNEKILKAYSNLCNKESLRKANLKIDESNEMNYYNTQEYSFLNTNDKSINENERNFNSIHVFKNNKNKFNSKRTVPLLTEIVGNKKQIKLKGLYLQKYNNYNINY